MALPIGTRIALMGIAAGAVGVLVFSQPDDGVLEYVYVNQVVTEPGKFQGREFKVHGKVVEGTVRQKKGGEGDYTFVVEYEGERLNVHYLNLVPDTFAEGGEVVLTGRLNSAGDTLESSEMSAKCPSKYEAEQS